MANKKQQQTTIIILTATLLLVCLFLGMMFIPTAAPKTTGGEDDSTVDTTPVSNQKYDVTGRIFDKDGEPMANTKFSISLGPSDFTTDENGFFVFKNLPIGVYTLSAYDEDGNRIGSTEFQLSSDGAFTIGNYSFELGEIVTLGFNGEKFYAVKVNDNVTNIVQTPENESITVEPMVEDDSAYTDLSWMNNVEPDYIGSGLSPYHDPDLFFHMINNDEYDIFNSYFLYGNTEHMIYQAKELTKEGAKFWVCANECILNTTGIKVMTDKLKSNWRELLTEIGSQVYEIGGDLFQGFYFLLSLDIG